MKKKIIPLLLIIAIILETVILYNQNIELKGKNSNITRQLEDSGILIDGEIYLKELQEEKEELEKSTSEVFKEEDVEEVFQKQQEVNIALNSEISELEDKIIKLENSIISLREEYNKLVKENEAKHTFYITNVPVINQYPDYPTGCESVALTILLNYYGVAVTPDNIISYLPKGDAPYSKDGKLYGGNPELEFVGNPYSLNSFGVYEKPLAEVANKFKPGIKIATGTDFDEIIKIVGSGKPVIVWTSMNLATPYISKSWIYEPTGETIYWKANEHAVVVIGYTSDKVIISDPIGGQVKYQSLSIFKERYNYYGKKALYY